MLDNVVDWEGERLNPSNANLDTAANHIIRYQFAKPYLTGKVLDAACGAGYGAYLLAEGYDGEVHGIDIEQSAVRRGRGQAIAQQLGAQYFVMPSLANH